MRYYCPRYPNLSISGIRFVNGVLETDDPEVMKVVESNSWFGVFIFKGDFNDKESEGGIPPVLSDSPEPTSGAGASDKRSGGKAGRKASPVLSELEEIVRRSGIIGK